VNLESLCSALKARGWCIGVSLLPNFSVLSYRHYVVVRSLSDRLLTVKSGVFIRRDHFKKIVSDFVDLAQAETATLHAGPL
jgi:LysR family transcriptional regulator, benzoate and cis,cis-muconate-responsive activator of ben and cat genes